MQHFLVLVFVYNLQIGLLEFACLWPYCNQHYLFLLVFSSCWVSFTNNLVWTFVTPVLLVCLVRFSFFHSETKWNEKNDLNFFAISTYLAILTRWNIMFSYFGQKIFFISTSRLSVSYQINETLDIVFPSEHRRLNNRNYYSQINAVILSIVVREILKMQSAKTSELERIRQGAKACVVLFPLLGMTWVFGILSVTDAGLVFQYIFTILNSLQVHSGTFLDTIRFGRQVKKYIYLPGEGLG